MASLIIKVKAWEIENKIQLDLITRKEISDKTKLNILTKSLAETVRSFGTSRCKFVNLSVVTTIDTYYLTDV